VFVERRSPAPLIDMTLVRKPSFSWVVTSGCLGNVGWAMAVFGATLYMQRVEGFDAFEAGAAFLAMSAGSALGGPAAGRLVPRFGAPPVLVVSLFLGAGALFWLSTGWPAASFAGALFFTGLFTGTAYSATNIGAMAAAPGAETGEASGIALTALLTAAAVAISISGSMISAASPGHTAGRIALTINIGAMVTLAGAVIMLAAARRQPGRVPAASPARGGSA
jgi:MFS family permease